MKILKIYDEETKYKELDVRGKTHLDLIQSIWHKYENTNLDVNDLFWLSKIDKKFLKKLKKRLFNGSK